MIKQQFYKNTKTHKNIFEHFFMLRTYKLIQMHYSCFLGLGHNENFRSC
jgi:hypothetical protein